MDGHYWNGSCWKPMLQASVVAPRVRDFTMIDAIDEDKLAESGLILIVQAPDAERQYEVDGTVVE